MMYAPTSHHKKTDVMKCVITVQHCSALVYGCNLTTYNNKLYLWQFSKQSYKDFYMVEKN